MAIVVKRYECLKCGKVLDHTHESFNDTTKPPCPNGHGDMVRLYTPPIIGGMKKDWTVGKSADQIAGVLANEFDP